ncbi:MAG: hypothetical protein U0Q12_12355 [Vicinamibacterales bacterium]
MTKPVCRVIIALGVLFTMLPSGTARAQDPQQLLLQGDMALWTVAVKPDKTAEFEQVMGRLRTALQESEKPERRLQGKSWKVLRVEKALPDGNVAYVHVVSQPVPDADYTVLRILYEAFPAEAKSIYELYTSAFAANLSLATGDVVIDFAKQP